MRPYEVQVDKLRRSDALSFCCIIAVCLLTASLRLSVVPRSACLPGPFLDVLWCIQ